MARTSENENIARDTSATASAESKGAFDAGQADIGAFNKNEGILRRGGEVAANPWLSARYLANQNRLQSESLNGATDAGTAELQQANRRSGGLNGAVTTGAVKDLALKKMRLADTLSAERGAQDFNKNVGYQQEMASAPLRAASVEEPFYASANGLTAATNNDLLGYQKNKFSWNQYLQNAQQGAASAAASAGA